MLFRSDAICRSAVRLCDAVYSVAMRVEGGLVHLGAQHNWPKESWARAQEMFPMPLDREHLSSVAIRERRVIHVDRLQDDPDLPETSRELARLGGYQALLLVPMIRGAEAIGAIAVARKSAFSDDQIALLKTFADQAVIAIENARLFNETQEALERQTATAEILHVISRSQTDLQPVFETIATNAKQLCNGDQGLVFTFDGELLHIASLKAMTPEEEDSARQVWPAPPGRGKVTARAVLTRSIVHVPDVLEDPEYEVPDTAHSGGWRSVISVPMLRGGDPIGTITVTRRQPAAFSEHQISLLKTFADQAVIAIENVRLFQELEARNRDLSQALERQTATAEILRVISSSPTDIQPVLDAVASSASRFCNASDAQIFRLEGDGLRKVAVFGSIPTLAVGGMIPVSRGTVAGRSVVDRRTIHVPDLPAVAAAEYPASQELLKVSGHRATLATPLLRQGQPIGAIIIRRLEARPFSDSQVKLLETFADQAVIAIENVRLFNETQEALERQTATAEILQVIASSPSDVQPVFDAIAGSAARIFASYDATITLLQDGMFHFRAWAGPPDSEYDLEGARSIFPFPFDADRTASSRAISERRIVEIVDTEEPGALSYVRDSGKAGRFRSGVWVPLLREGQGIGSLVLTRASRGAPMAEKQLALLRTFADQAVIAIENVRLFNETQEALERQTATAKILKAISESPTDTQPVLDAIAVTARELFDGSSAGIALRRGDRIELVATAGMDDTEQRALRDSFPRPIDLESTVNHVVVRGVTVHYPDVTAPEVPAYTRDTALAAGVGAMLGVPLLREGRSVGAILMARPHAGAFADKEIDLLRTFADQAVIAIENTRLFNETKEALEQQTASAEVLQAISRSLDDTRPVFDVILQSCERLFQGRHAGDRKSTRLNSSHSQQSRMPSSA